MSRDHREQVLGIVGRVLRVEQVDTGQDLFDLGADSLAVLQLIEQIRRDCGVVVRVIDAFDAPDIDAFVATVTDRMRARPDR